jgi:drug/metabolite transporter (DMT)-like permease
MDLANWPGTSLAAMLAAVLALASSLSWGLSDFLGGFQSRRHSLLSVLVLSQGFALVVLGAAIAAGAPIGHDAAATAWAVGSGMLGLLGLTAFYRALAIGTMSIVAPLSATGAVIPVLVGLASGERPRTLQVFGMALAMIGVVLAGREATGPAAQARRTGRTAVLLALLAAVGFGSFFAGMDRAEESGDVAWVLLAARTPEVLLLLAACAVRRPGLPLAPDAVGAIAAIGFFDLLANLLFVLATGRGLLSVVGVLGALYPAVTVLLARVVLHERLTRTQDAGVLVTLAGVVALAAGA